LIGRLGGERVRAGFIGHAGKSSVRLKARPVWNRTACLSPRIWGAPPDAGRVCEYGVKATPLDKEPPGTISGGGGLTTRGNEAELDTPLASVAVTETVYVACVVVFPLSSPALVREKPEGNPEPENV
jgi:hypothetical protein